MNIILTFLILFSAVTPMNLNTQTILRETVSFIYETTYTGVSAESEIMFTRLTLKLLLRRGIAEEIDFERYYTAVENEKVLRILRNIVVSRYNRVLKILELRNIEIPNGIPRRMMLEPEGWAVTFRYI